MTTVMIEERLTKIEQSLDWLLKEIVNRSIFVRRASYAGNPRKAMHEDQAFFANAPTGVFHLQFTGDKPVLWIKALPVGLHGWYPMDMLTNIPLSALDAI